MTTAFLHAAASLCVFAGATCLYLGTRRQNLLPRANPSARRSLLGGAVFLLVGAAFLGRLMAPATAVFTELAMLMAALIALPCVAALRKGRSP